MNRLILSAFCALALVATAAFGQQEKIDQLVKKIAPDIIKMREHIHQNPELGNREFKTAELVANHLRSLGMEVTTGVAHTGVVGLLKGGKPGPVVAVRADMDALPVTEETGYSFKSTTKTQYLGKEVGVMHACGHDIHTSVQLGVASVLAALKDELPGTVKFIFQPAEEGPPPDEEGGAELMMKEKVLENPRPSAIFGLHTLASMEVGKVGYTSGPAMAAVDHFKIDLHGKQAHGAKPEESIDPIVMASQVVMAFQTIRARSLPPLAPSVVTVGIIQAGERFNIIPASAHIEGTVRTYDAEVRNTVEQRMHAILKGITGAYGGSYEMQYDRGAPATINNPELTAQMIPSIVSVLGEENVEIISPTMTGEDFAYFALDVPGLYYRLGMVKPGTVSGGHHTPTFAADNEAVSVGMRVMSRLLVDYLEMQKNAQ